MELNYQTDKLIIVCYQSFAGGKFLMNCLALSRHATFQCKYRVARDFNLDLNSMSYYNSKLKIALESLPPSKEFMKDWRNYEYGCVQLFNWFAGSSCTKELSNDIVSAEVKFLSNQKEKNFFIVAHNHRSLKRILNYFPNAKILILTDFIDFRLIATSLKDDNITDPEKYSKKTMTYEYTLFINSFFEYKIDYTISYADIFEEDKFLDRVKILYDELGYDDFNHDLVQKFYQAYISLHI